MKPPGRSRKLPNARAPVRDSDKGQRVTGYWLLVFLASLATGFLSFLQSPGTTLTADTQSEMSYRKGGTIVG